MLGRPRTIFKKIIKRDLNVLKSYKLNYEDIRMAN